MYTKTSFSVSSPPQCWSQAVVCVSTPRMYPRSGYFLVKIESTLRYGILNVETGAKKIGLVFWAISGIKNGFTAFC